MLIKYVICLLLTFTTLASLLDPALEKSFFYIRPKNHLTYQLFQTRNGIIAYSIEAEYLGKNIPQYTLINLESNTVTPILSNLVSSCGQGPSAFSRLHYHVATSNLVYYCSNNNSLLVLDEETYNIENSIPTGATGVFEEVKLSTDGFSVVIVGMGGLLTSNPAPSHLILVSMQTYQVEKHVIFNQGMRVGEAVTGYATNNRGTYILTNKIAEGTNEVSIYSMILIGNQFSLYFLKSVTADVAPTQALSEFYIVGELMYTNSNKGEIIIMSQEGAVVANIPGLVTKVINSSPSFARVALVSEYGSSDLYAQITNSSIVKISAQGVGFKTQLVGTASDIQYVVANRTTNTLLFTIDPLALTFTITDLVASQTVYKMPTTSDNVFITSSTYAVSQTIGFTANLFIFSTQTNALIANLQINSVFYYDEQQYILSYFQFGQTCQLAQVDLVSGQVFVSYTFNTTSADDCTLKPIQVSNNGHSIIEFAVMNYSIPESYEILTQGSGLVTFAPPTSEESSTETLIVDYDSLTVYHVVGYNNPSQNSIFVYNFESNTQSFTLQTSQNYTDLPLGLLAAVGNSVVVMPQEQVHEVSVISIPSLSESKYPFTQPWAALSTFQDNSGGFYVVLSAVEAFGGLNELPGIFNGGQVQNLAGATSNTVYAQAAGLCSYYLVDGVVTGFGFVRIYNVCNGGESLEIYT